MGDVFPQRLRHEAAKWAADGLVTPQQAQAIVDRYPLADRRHDRTVQVLAWIGALLIGAGLIVWVGTNWKDMPAAARILLIATVTAAAFALGAFLQQRGYRHSSHAVVLLGGLGYGGLLAEIANSYHLQAHSPMLLALWVAGLLPVSYVFRNGAVHLLALLIVPWWAADAFLLQGDLEPGRVAASVFAACGAAVLGLGLLHPRRGEPGRLPPFQDLHTAVGTLLCFVPAFVLTFWDRVPPVEAMPGIGTLLLWMAAALAVAAGLAAAVSRRAAGMRAAAALLPAALLPMLLVVPGGLAMDLAYGLAIVALVVAAVQSSNEPLFNLALALFLVEVLGRYIEFVADIHNPAFVFVVGGVLLLALAFALEAVRRRVARRMRGAGA